MTRISRTTKEEHNEFSDDSFEAPSTSTLRKASKYGNGWKNHHQQELEESSDDSTDFEISLLSRKPEKTKKDSNTRLTEYLNQIEKRRARIMKLNPTFQRGSPRSVKKRHNSPRKRKVRDKRENFDFDNPDLSNHYEMLKTQFESLRKEHENLKDHHETLKHDRDLLQVEHKNLLEENTSLRSESDNSQKEELEEEIRKLRNEKNAAEETKKHLKEAQKQKELELSQIRQQNDEIKRMHAVLKQKYGELTSNLEKSRRGREDRDESDDSDDSDEETHSNDSDNETHEDTRKNVVRGLKREWYIKQLEAWKRDQPYISKVALERKKQQVKHRWKQMNAHERMEALRRISDGC